MAGAECSSHFCWEGNFSKQNYWTIPGYVHPKVVECALTLNAI